MEKAESITLRKLQERFGDYILRTHSHRGDDTAVIRREALLDVCRFLRDDPDLKYNFLMDITAVDYLKMEGVEPRFEVVYHLFSLEKRQRVRIKVPVQESDPEVDSLVQLWPAANWFEREVWDMFGIKFRGHPDLRRLLMYEEFVGHPLRKDYPITLRQPRVPERPVKHPVPRAGDETP